MFLNKKDTNIFLNIGVHGFVFALLFWVSAAHADTPSDAMMFYYKSPDPEKVTDIIREMDRSGLLKQGSKQGFKQAPFIGFMAGICTRYPEHKDAWLDPKYEPNTEYALAGALAVADMQKEAVRYAKERGFYDDMRLFLENPPKISNMWASQAAHLDMLWGASFATGERTYVEAMLTAFTLDLQASTIQRDDILIAIQRTDENYNLKVKALAEKYGAETFRKLVFLASILWSIDSNSMHEFVALEAMSWVMDNPQGDVSYLLLQILKK